MTTERNSNACTVGAANMGHQIAVGSANAGYNAKCTDVAPEILETAEKSATSYLSERVARGRLTEEGARMARANLRFTLGLEEAARDADLAIEAVSERLQLKRGAYVKLDDLCPPQVILDSDSSFIPSPRFADATGRPDRVCNMHFQPGAGHEAGRCSQRAHTYEATASVTMEVARSTDKIPVLAQKEIRGFIVSRILAAINNDALFLRGTGVAFYEDIDTAIVYGPGRPMGPFRLMDLTGIDLNYIANLERYQETGGSQYKPSPFVVG